MRTFWVTVLFLLAHFAQTFAGTDWSLIVPGLDKRVVRVESLSKGAESPSICSAAVLHKDAGYVVTCEHCVTGELEAVTVGGRHAVVVKQNKLLDLAVLRSELHDVENMPLAAKVPLVGSDVAILGWSWGSKRLHMQFGRVSLPLDDDGSLVIDGMAIGGNSGGPTINAQGEMVGLTSYIRGRGAMHLAYLVPTEKVRAFVEPYLPAQKK